MIGKFNAQKFLSVTLVFVMIFGVFAGIPHITLRVSASTDSIGADFKGIAMPRAGANGFIAPIDNAIPADAIHIKTADELSRIGNDSMITVNLSPDSTVDLTVLDNGNDKAEIITPIGNDFSILHEFVNNNDIETNITISGIANGNVKTLATDDGIIVTSDSLTDITVSISENDIEVDSLIFSTDNDSVLIKNNNNIATVYIDENGDGNYDIELIQSINNYTINATAGTGGTFADDIQITLTATPNTGYSFDGWYENNVKIAG